MKKFIKLTKGAVRHAVTAIAFCVAGVLHADISHSYIWTGAAGDGDPANANNWKDSVTGEAVVPTSMNTVKIQGSVNLQCPAGTDIFCKAFEIGDCTFTADCDWSGLSTTPSLTGSANLAGYDLMLPALAVVSGGAFANSASDVSRVVFKVPDSEYSDFNEALFLTGFADLVLGDNVKLQLSKGGDGTFSSTNFKLGQSATALEMVQTNGTVSLSSSLAQIGATSSADVTYLMKGGTLNSTIDFEVGAYGHGEFVQTGGSVLLSNWLNIGRRDGSSCSGVLTVNGGTLTNSYKNVVFNGCSGSTGTINVGGDAVVSFYRLGCASYAGGSKSYLNISGNGTLTTESWVTLHGNGGGYAEANQSGGTFNCGAEFTVGEGGTGVYNMSDGALNVAGTLYIGRATSATGTFTQTGGDVTAASVYLGQPTQGGTATYTLSGGTLTTASISQYPGCVGNFTLAGGTLKANSDGTFMSGVTALRCMGSDSKFDTNGKNVTISGCSAGFAYPGSCLTKTGEGTLTFDALPAVETLTVSKGTIALSADNVNSSVGLAHRWSFTDGSLVDSIGNVTATTLPETDPALTFENNAVALTGSGHNTGSLNLGTGLVDPGDVTIEIWATRTAHKDWSRVFDIGSDRFNYLLMTWGNDHRVALVQNGSEKALVRSTFAFENGVANHISMTIKANADGSSTASWAQRNVETGNIVNSGSFTQANWSIMELVSKTFLLGRAFHGNLDANAIYDEVRIWRGALSEESLTQSVINGPDATTEQIAAVANMTTETLDGRTLEIAEGGTVSLGGHTLTQPNLTGNGTIENGTLKVSGMLKINVGDCLTLAEGTVLDLSDATVEILDPENLTRGFTFVRGGTVVGTPIVKNLPNGWRLAIGRTARIARNVFSIIVR